MGDLSAGIILAIGGAGLLAALAFRYLIETVIRLNNKLQETIQERHEYHKNCEQFMAKMGDMEIQIARQSAEIQQLQAQLTICKELLERSQTVPTTQ